MTTTDTVARGTFTVKLSPVDPSAEGQAAGLGRRAIEKTFTGDLEGTSKGEMLSVGTPVQGSAGYVAIERVEATLGGRRGSFVLQHDGRMNRGTPSLAVNVVPDSGTDALTGLSGSLEIRIESGVHHYTFAYALPST